MSAGRSFKRAAGRSAGFRPRRPDVELSAECRRRLAEVIRAHDSDDVTLADFLPLIIAFGEWLAGRPEAERLEACAQIGEVSIRNITGRPALTAVGWLTGGSVGNRSGRL